MYIARNFYAPWFSWTENNLSDLGGDIGETPIWAAHGVASILFNCGLTIVGILGVVFACGLKNTQRMPSGRLGALLFILDMCALCCVGIFPLTTGVPHWVASMSLFLLAPFSLWLLGAGFLDSFEKVWGVFSIIIGAIIIVGLFVLPVLSGFKGYAIPEIILAIALSVYSITLGVKLFKQPQQE